jgi:hypothetical protein
MTKNAIRILVAIVVLLVGGLLLGAIGVVLTTPLVGWLLSRVVMDSAIGGYRAARAVVYADVQGRYYAFRDVSIAVVQDMEGYRWLRVKDIRRVLPAFPKDATLKSIEPERTGCGPEGKDTHIRADALLHWLSKAQSDDGIRFKVWVEHKVHFPSEAAHRSRGASQAAPDTAAGPLTPEDEAPRGIGVP